MTSCPPLITLKQFLADQLPEPEAATVGAHADTCSLCQTVLDELSEDLDLRQLAAAGQVCNGSAARDGEPPHGPGLDWLLHVLRASTSPPFTTGPGDVAGEGEPLPFLGPPRRNGDLGTLGPYLVEAELGRGGMGVVLRCHDEALQRTVAVKVLRPELARPTARARFVREARAAARIRHDHVISVHAVAELSDGLPYLVMEHLAGPTLAELIRSRQQLTPAQAALYIRQAAEGLAAAHEAGLVHRDVKPGNILLDTATGRVKITDFGLARAAERPSDLTQEGNLAGTPAYMSPEQARGADALDARSDVYGLGVTLYEALTGDVPFHGAPHMVLQQVLSDEPRPPRRLNDAIPRDLETVCLKAMAKEPVRRYPTARDFADDLRRWQAGEPIRARPVGPFGRLVRWCRRKPVLAGLLALLVLALAGALGQWWRAESRSAEALANAAEAESQRVLALGYLEDSRENFRDARHAVDTFFSLAEKNNVFRQPTASPLNKQLLEETLRYYQKFVQRQQDDPSVRAELAEAYYRVGTLTLWSGDRTRALASLREAQARYRNLVRATGRPAHRRLLAESAFHIGLTCEHLGRFPEALQALAEARDQFAMLSRLDPRDATLRANVVTAAGSMANIHYRLQQHAEARANYLYVRKVQEQMVREFPAVKGYRVQLARTLNNLGLVAPDAAAAMKYQEQARALREELYQASPDHPLYIQELARSCKTLGMQFGARKKTTEALAQFDRAVTLYRQAIQIDPHLLPFQRELAETWLERGKLLLDRSRPAEALSSFQAACRLYEALIEASPHDVQVRDELGLAYFQCGTILRDQGQTAEARTAFEKLLKNLEVLERDFPRDAARFRANAAAARSEMDRLRSATAPAGQ